MTIGTRLERRKAPDFTIQDEGTLFLLQPLNETAEEWVDVHIEADAQHWFSAVVVEHRYIRDIIHALQEEGFKLSSANRWEVSS